MNYIKPLVVTGTVTRVGSGFVGANTSEITVVEITEDNGNVVAVDDVVVSNKMANYMAAGERTTIHFVRTEYLHSMPIKKRWYVYAIDSPNRRLEDWPFTLGILAQYRIIALVLIVWFGLTMVGGVARQSNAFGLLFTVGLFLIPVYFLIKSIRRTAKLIRVVEEDLGREVAKKKGIPTSVKIFGIGLVGVVALLSVLNTSMFKRFTGEEKEVCETEFQQHVSIALYFRSGFNKDSESQSTTSNSKGSAQCGQYYASALEKLPTWDKQTQRPIGAYLNGRKHSIYLGGPVGLKVAELSPENFGLEGGSGVVVPVVQVAQGPGDPMTISFPTLNDATQYRDALANTIHRYRGRVITLD